MIDTAVEECARDRQRLEARAAGFHLNRRPPMPLWVGGFERGDRVITPLGEKARILGRAPGGRLELRYEEAFSEYWAYVALKPKLLRKVIPGKRLPEPVRLVDWYAERSAAN